MSGFGRALSELLRDIGKSNEDLARFLAANGKFKTSSAAKEHLRILRNSGAPVTAYPNIGSIIAYFEDNGRHDVASVTRVIFAEVSQSEGLSFKASSRGSGSLLNSFIAPRLDNKVFLTRWTESIDEGGIDLYRESLVLFNEFASSPVHAPLRKSMWLQLARAAITYGDYRDAFILAARYQAAFERYFGGMAPKSPERKISMKLNPNDIVSLLRSKIVAASALSHMFFFEPVRASANFYDDAEQAIQQSRELTIISEQTAAQLRFELDTSKLRMLVRDLWSNHRNEACKNTVLTLADDMKRVFNSVPMSARFKYLAADTLSRAYSVAAGEEATRDQGLIFLGIARSISDDLDQKAVRRSALRMYRNAVSTAVYYCMQAKDSRGGRAVFVDKFKQELFNVTVAFGVDQMRHSRYVVQALVNFAMMELGEIASIKPPTIPHFADQETIEQNVAAVIARLTRTAAQVEEKYFSVSHGDPLFRFYLESVGGVEDTPGITAS